MKKLNMLYLYELAVLGVLYFILVGFQVMSKNINGWLILIGLIVLYIIDWAYFRFVKSRI